MCFVPGEATFLQLNWDGGSHPDLLLLSALSSQLRGLGPALGSHLGFRAPLSDWAKSTHPVITPGEAGDGGSGRSPLAKGNSGEVGISLKVNI